MKIATLAFALSSAVLATAIPLAAQAQQTGDQPVNQTVQIVQRGPDHRATVVRIGDKDYPVCTKTTQQSGCIEPRAAGLKWGDRPLNNWPGKPASEIDGDQGHIGN